MIPRAHITAWRSRAPWPTDAQVEQDLVLARALVEMFGRRAIAQAVAFRGGTALHKLFVSSPGRYSEDIDLVQVEGGPIGKSLDEIRASLDPWLGEPRWNRGEGRVSLVYRFETTARPVQKSRLKVEINTREHACLLGFEERPFRVQSPWFEEEAAVRTFKLDELLATKMRALYQRKTGRDLFDLWMGLEHAHADPATVVECFRRYMPGDRRAVSRAQFEANLSRKMRDRSFLEDVLPLLPAGSDYRAGPAETRIRSDLVSRLPGDPWRGRE